MAELSNGVPGFVFIFSNEEMPRPKRAPAQYIPRPTRQAVDSAASWAELFQTEGDYSVFLPGRFFNVYRADATAVTANQNAQLCSERAPILILTDKDGKVTAVMEGRAAIKRARVVVAMAEILRRDGCIQNDKPFSRLQELMLGLENVEIGIQSAEAAAKSAAAALAKAQASKAAKKKGELTSSGMTAKDNADKAENKLRDLKMSKYKILVQEYALLKELGVPSTRMPREPVDLESASQVSGRSADYR